MALTPSLAACQPSASNGAELGLSPAGLTQVPLSIGKHRFTVEVARTPED